MKGTLTRDQAIAIAGLDAVERVERNNCDHHEQLIDELLDSTILKTEREHAAAREIEKNQDRIAAGHRLALELECLLLDTKDLPTVSRWWASGIEALDEWQKLFPYNGPRLGD